MTTQSEQTPNPRRWLALYTRMHHEIKVRDRLTALGIQCFLPTQIVERQWSDRKKKVEKVLISMMIFVHVDAHEQRRVLQVPSVMRYMVLRGERQPTEIPRRQMEYFRFMVDQSDTPVTFNTSDLQPGEKVRVIKGALKGLKGEMVTINGKSNIAIRIDMLGCATIEMAAGMVERVIEK